ncbi:MAG: hypothetical protein EA369_03210 [Bradymonadales bacterium]|nr:MAG: hypothetical protein EA369_03210 [Bradymonadales bacterium]
MSLEALYISAVVFSLLATNCLILLTRQLHQLKKAPEEADYLALEREMKQMEFKLESQGQEVLDLQLRLEELKEQLAKEVAEKNSLSNPESPTEQAPQRAAS